MLDSIKSTKKNPAKRLEYEKKMLEEMPVLLKLVADVEANADIQAFWIAASLKCPTWFEVKNIFTLICPNSAGAERVFSYLSRSWSKNQKRAKEDLVSASVMRQYNNRKVKMEHTPRVTDDLATRNAQLQSRLAARAAARL